MPPPPPPPPPPPCGESDQSQRSSRQSLSNQSACQTDLTPSPGSAPSALPLTLPPAPPPPPCRTTPPLPGSGAPTVIFSSGLAEGPLKLFSVKIKKPDPDQVPDAGVELGRPEAPVRSTERCSTTSTTSPSCSELKQWEHLRIWFKTKAQGPAVDLTLSRQKILKTVSKVSAAGGQPSKKPGHPRWEKAGDRAATPCCRAIHDCSLQPVSEQDTSVLHLQSHSKT
ncbi:hypothetical protein WMY93_032627 [Mugilogobius chulae]|uniref:Uncharacterized protein n=1 Tax=Mugilogobius chulae TaxID=88201 RepID=A0AAW0MNH6_9GOBI